MSLFYFLIHQDKEEIILEVKAQKYREFNISGYTDPGLFYMTL
jgi:hypothetical protein